MNSNKTKTDRLTNAKNVARGAIASLRQTVQAVSRRGDEAPIKRTTGWNARQATTFQLNKAIAQARSRLSKNDLQEFNRWLNELLPALDHNSTKLGVDLSALGIFPVDLSTRNLESELSDSVQRLQNHLPEIIKFATMAREIAGDIGRLQYQKAATSLDEAKNILGYSFWYIESYLALTRLNYGIEKLKHEVEILSIRGGGHKRFLFYYFGVRNEPAQSSLRFRSSVKKVIEESDLAISLKSYLKFRLYGSLEPRSGVLAAILAYEQSTTLIDLFFTLTKICNLIISQRTYFPTSAIYIAEQALDTFGEAIDTFPLGITGDEFAPKEICELTVHALNFLFDGKEQIEVFSTDVQAVSAVAAQLSTRGNQLQTDEASKAFINMSWLPIANAIGEIQDIPSLPALALSNDFSTLSTPFLIELHKAITTPIIEGYSEQTIKILKKFWFIHTLRHEQLLDQLVEFLRSELKGDLDGNVEDAFSVLFADALHETGNLQECISVCSRAGLTNERLLPLLPLASLFIGKRWVTMRSLGPSVNLAIALSHACKVIDDEKLRTFKRFATEELLVEYSCLTIDELIPKLATGEDHEVVAYFGYNVCDISTIELLPGMGESRLVRRTRVKLLRRLSELRTNRAIAFETEAQSIEDALQVDDGLSVLDDSKVHVDEEAVVNYISGENQADFQRYKKLVSSGIGKSESLTDILKYADNPSARIFQIPKNDADDLLVQLINNIMQRFLYDPASGLDIIIGRRIRHNTISSELRGVLEKDELIGIIHHARYLPSNAVIRACMNVNPKQKKIVFAANARFSEAIDQLVALLRDHYFNVKSRSKPRGVFELTINPVLFSLIRSAAQTCSNLEQFTRECIDSFWMFLSFKLDVTRPDIETEVRRSLQNTFGKFSSELTGQHVDITLISSVQRAAEELQRRAILIASWIGVPKVLLEARSHGLSNTIDIAVAVVSGQVPGFQPIMTQLIRTDIELDSRGFGIVSDALYVVIYNVAQHSGKRVNNNISVVIDFIQERSILVFDITSETAPSARKADKVNKLQAIRTDIQKRTFVDGARRNKHSGLYKLAALVHQSADTSLTFDFIQKDKFNVQFELSYIPLNDVGAPI